MIFNLVILEHDIHTGVFFEIFHFETKRLERFASILAVLSVRNKPSNTHIVNCSMYVLGLYIFVSGFRMAYQCRHISKGAYNPNKKSASKQAKAMLIRISLHSLVLNWASKVIINQIHFNTSWREAYNWTHIF